MSDSKDGKRGDEEPTEGPENDESSRVARLIGGPVGKPENAPPAVVVPLAAIAKLLRDSAQASYPAKSRVFSKAFYVDENFLVVADRRVRSQMSAVGAEEVRLSALVTYPDRSTESFHDLQECFELAADERDPESLSLIWTGLAGIHFYEARMELVTEKPFDDHFSRVPLHEAVGITIATQAPTREWVRSTFEKLEALMQNARVSVLFRPLEVLRSSLLVEVLSWTLGSMAWYVLSRFVTDHLGNKNKGERLAEVLSSKDLESRFESYIIDVYSPNGSFAIGLAAFVIPYVALFGVYFISNKYLRYLVPRSAINIGLSARRYLEYVNAFRFVVFTLMIGSILGVLVNLVSDLI